MKRLVLAAGLAVLVSAPLMTDASVLDPPPLLQGQTSRALFTVSGVTTAGGIGTYFSCTSAATVSILVSVELFDAAGTTPINDASAVSVNLAPGATVVFATQNENDAFCNAVLLGAPVFLSGGSARILATQKGLVCSAFLADAYNAPPTSMVPLNVVAKNKQKGV